MSNYQFLNSNLYQNLFRSSQSAYHFHMKNDIVGRFQDCWLSFHARFEWLNIYVTECCRFSYANALLKDLCSAKILLNTMYIVHGCQEMWRFLSLNVTSNTTLSVEKYIHFFPDLRLRFEPATFSLYVRCEAFLPT